MRKSITLIAAALILIITCSGLVWAQEEEMCVPMGEITLKSIATESQRAPVAFRHNLHFGYSCQTCHHKWNQQETIKGCSAAGCHDIAQTPKTEDGKPLADPIQQIRYYKNAFHASCIGCHKEIKKKNEELEASQLTGEMKLAPTGPTGCIQCHPKEY